MSCSRQKVQYIQQPGGKKDCGISEDGRLNVTEVYVAGGG